MSKLLLFLILLLLFSCGSHDVAGGISEAGNGFIQISVISSAGVKVPHAPVVLTPRDYIAGSHSVELPIQETDHQGKTEIFSESTGEFNVFIEMSDTIMVLSPCSIWENDTTHLTVQLVDCGSISSTTVQEIVIPGAPRLFTMSDNSVYLPAGTHDIQLRDHSGNSIQQECVIIPHETTEVENSYTKTKIHSSAISAVYNVAFDGETTAYATGSGLTLERSGVREQFTKENSPLLSNWIRDVYISDDTLTMGTDSGIVIFTENDTTHLRGGTEIPHDWVIHFLKTENELWFVTQTGIGTLRDGSVQTLFNSDNSPLPSDGISSLAESDEGGILVGTHTGVFKFQNGNWISDNNFPETFSSVASSAIGGSWNDLWLATNGNGLFHKNGEVWIHYNDLTSNLTGAAYHTLIMNGSKVLFGGKEGTLIEGRESPFSLTPISSSDIISLNYRHDGSLWIGTLYEGVTVLMR